MRQIMETVKLNIESDTAERDEKSRTAVIIVLVVVIVDRTSPMR